MGGNTENHSEVCTSDYYTVLVVDQSVYFVSVAAQTTSLLYLERMRAVVRPGVEITSTGQSDNRSIFSRLLFTINSIMLYHWFNYHL